MCFLMNSMADYGFENIFGKNRRKLNAREKESLISCIQTRRVAKGAHLYGPRSPRPLLEGWCIRVLRHLPMCYAYQSISDDVMSAL